MVVETVVDLRLDGRVDAVEWRFFPSQASRRVADGEALFDALKAAGIPYYVYLR